MTASHQVAILGSVISLPQGATGLAPYWALFMEEYDSEPPEGTTGTTWRIVQKDEHSLGPARALAKVDIHRSKHHPRWCITGVLRSDGWLIWSDTGMRTYVSEADRTVTVSFEEHVDPLTRGELVFHICRSLALYSWNRANSVLLHAAAVATRSGGVLFQGPKASGKTSLMMAAVYSGIASPMANDRVLLSSRGQLDSWPGYVSIWEDTLLSCPILIDAAVAYESASYATQRWGALQAQSGRKRLFPMKWLTDALSTRYVRACALSRLVFPRADVATSTLEVRDISDDVALVCRGVADNVFRGPDESFCPWHGLTVPAGEPDLVAVVSRLLETGVRALECTFNPQLLFASDTYRHEALAAVFGRDCGADDKRLD